MFFILQYFLNCLPNSLDIRVVPLRTGLHSNRHCKPILVSSEKVIKTVKDAKISISQFSWFDFESCFSDFHILRSDDRLINIFAHNWRCLPTLPIVKTVWWIDFVQPRSNSRVGWRALRRL